MFNDFIDDYLSNMTTNEPLYIIAEKAEELSIVFLYKMRELLKHKNIKLVFGYKDPTVKPEFIKVFDDKYCEINFNKPSYDAAEIIIKNLNLINDNNTKKLYNESANFKDFLIKYNNIFFSNKEVVSQIESDIYNVLGKFKGAVNECFIQFLKTYLVRNAYLNSESVFDNILLSMMQKGLIVKNGKDYFINFDSQTLIIWQDGFFSYILNDYKKLNFNILYHILCANRNLFTTDMLVFVACLSKNETEIANILSSVKIESFEQYVKIFKHLFNLNCFS